MRKPDPLLDPIRRPDGSLPPFPDFHRPCLICGEPNDHFHSEWRDGRWVVVEEPDAA